MKFILLILTVFIATNSLSSNSQEIGERKVIANAKLFLQTKDLLKSAKIFKLNKLLEKEANKIYIHNVGKGDGWIISEMIDDNIRILAYSLDGNFDYDKAIPYVKNWLKSNLNNTLEINAKTTKAISNKNLSRGVEPFLKTSSGEDIQWAQRAPYNSQCPVIDGIQTPSGCGPVAVAQVMRYWQFPPRSKGNCQYSYTISQTNKTHSFSHRLGQSNYNWEKMLPKIDESSTEESKRCISNLMLDIGMSMKAIYTPEGTGASDFSIFNKYFNYSLPQHISIYDGLLLDVLKSKNDSILFHEKIKENLDNKIPVIVIGHVSGGGHAMICDGYDDEGFYHLNYGWGGQSDGFYHYTQNIWCADLLFSSAYIDIVPQDIKYSISLKEYNNTVSPLSDTKIALQIEEADRSFPSYITPKIALKSPNNGKIIPEQSYETDSTNSQYHIYFKTPSQEGTYGLSLLIDDGYKIQEIDSLTMQVKNAINTRDLLIKSIETSNKFTYNSPNIEYKIELSNAEVNGSCKIRYNVYSKDVLEFTDDLSYNLSADKTVIRFRLSLDKISMGKKTLKIIIDPENQLNETDEKNNTTTINFAFNREIPLKEWAVLQEIYKNSEIGNWEFNKGWMLDEPISTWDGLTLENGHITEISNVFEKNVLMEPDWGTFEHGFNKYPLGLPETISELDSLRSIKLLYAEMNSKHLPQSIGELSQLELINLYHSGLSGDIPNEIGHLQNLKELVLDENDLNGELPQSIFDLSKLKVLRLGQNHRLTGSIDSILKFKEIEFIGISQTQLSGKIDERIFGLKKLVEIQAYNCNLSGEISKEIETNSKLLVIDLKNNNIEGEIFNTIKNCPNLRNLDVSGNQFSGNIPPEVTQLRDIFLFNISNNNFSGDLPLGFVNLRELDLFNVSNNQLTGIINKEFSYLRQARDLNFANNKFDELDAFVVDSLFEYIYNIDVSNNSLEFNSFEQNLDLIGKNYFRYSPQSLLGNKEVFCKKSGYEFVYKLSCAGTSNQYTWYKNDTVLRTINIPDIIIGSTKPDDSGIYHCVITNEKIPDFNLKSEPFELKIDQTTNEFIKIYPNPASDRITVNLQELEDQITSYSIIDNTGRIVHKMNNLSYAHSINIDVSFLSAGIYHIILIGDSIHGTKKIIIN